VRSQTKKKKSRLREDDCERKADREVVARVEAIHDKTDTNQMRLEPETDHQEKNDAWIVDLKDG
jgi:hypothetical protein